MLPNDERVHTMMHDLRHAKGTLMIDEGPELVAVQLIPGHACQLITADLYVGSVPITLSGRGPLRRATRSRFRMCRTSHTELLFLSGVPRREPLCWMITAGGRWSHLSPAVLPVICQTEPQVSQHLVSIYVRNIKLHAYIWDFGVRRVSGD